MVSLTWKLLKYPKDLCLDEQKKEKKKEKYDLEFLWAIKNCSSRGTLNSNWT